MTSLLNITVLYSPRPRVVVEHALQVPPNCTVIQAIEASGLLQSQPEIDLSLPQAFSVGIWGRKTTLTHGLKEGDRIEIYRSLLIDPKTARRSRAKA